jgi:hypothetical protein
MPSTSGYTEWGYLGALVFIVVVFVVYLVRRDMAAAKREEAAAKREQAMQSFFGRLFAENKGATSDLVKVIQELIKEFKDHDKITQSAISRMDERTRNKSDE